MGFTMNEMFLNLIGNGVAEPEPAYLGRESSSSFISYADLATLIGLNGTLINSTGDWLTFMDKGKKVYISTMPARTNFTWNTLNTLNVVFGRTVTISGVDYILRLMTGAVGEKSSIPGGEWNKYIYAVAAGRDPSWSGTRQAELTDAELGLSSSNTQGRANYCQETHPNGNSYCVNRGYTGPMGLSVSTKSVANTNSGWRPILIEV